MNAKYRRFSMQFAISVAVAIVTPAAAAGLVEGVSTAATTVADATAPNQFVSQDGAAGTDGGAAVSANAVTHAPARLSPLAGNDATAWADVGHPVRVQRKAP